MGFSRCRRCRGEDGVFLVVWALLLVSLFTMVAIVIDLGALRADRRKERLAADAAAAAGASELKNGSSAACTTALKYAVRNLGFDDSSHSCGTVVACDPNAPTESMTPATVGGYVIRVTHGVLNTSHLMNAEAVGGDITQAADETPDGKECERIGVEISYTRESIFGKVVGNDRNSTKVHSVATFRAITGELPNSLALLEPTGCNALQTTGNSGISVVIPVGKAGSIVTDSTGTGCSGGSTMRSDGNKGIIVCNEGAILGSCNATPVASPSGIYVNALNTPTCTGSCPYGGANTISPTPVRPPQMVTRSPVDYRYNCKTNYTNSGSFPNYENTTIAAGSGLPSCEDAPANGAEELDFINELVRRTLPPFVPATPVGGALAPPPPVTSVTNCGAEDWTIVRSRSVSCDPPINTVVNGDVVFTGNVTNHLTVNGNAVFTNEYSVNNIDLTIRGNAFFNSNFFSRGNVTIGATGAYPASCAATFAGFISNASTCLRSAGSNASLMIVRGNLEQQSGSSTWALNKLFVYATGRFLQQATASLSWTAPTEGPFAHLAYWQESNALSEMGGSGTLNFSGTFFAPRGRFRLQGGPAMSPQGAQFIALGLVTGGNATFKLQPNEALVSLPFGIGSTLIR